MHSTRRRLLGTLGAATATVALGGCLTGDTGTGDERGEDDDGVTVDDVTVQPAVVALNSPDSYGTYGQQAEQYVLAEVSVDDPPEHDPSQFTLRTADATYEPTTAIGESGGRLARFDEAYGTGDGGAGWLAFRVPKPLEADAATLAWDGGEREFEAPTVEQLNRPPTTFEVSFETPESVAVGEDLTATVTVENVGDVDGTFVGALNRVGPRVAYAPEEAIVLEVGAGESTRWEYTHSLDDPEISQRDDPRMQLYLRWRSDSVSREVDVETDGEE